MEAPYIVWGSRFLGEKSAGTLATDVGMADGNLPSEAERAGNQSRFGRPCFAAFAHRLLQGDC